jgi:hypothetical protein
MKHMNFARKLYEIVNYTTNMANKTSQEYIDYSKILSWHPHHDSTFVIWDKEAFMQHIAPRFFPTQNAFRSLERLLNMWTFVRDSDEESRLGGNGNQRHAIRVFYHPDFSRTDASRLRNIQRRNVPGNNSTVRAAPMQQGLVAIAPRVLPPPRQQHPTVWAAAMPILTAAADSSSIPRWNLPNMINRGHSPPLPPPPTGFQHHPSSSDGSPFVQNVNMSHPPAPAHFKRQRRESAFAGPINSNNSSISVASTGNNTQSTGAGLTTAAPSSSPNCSAMARPLRTQSRDGLGSLLQQQQQQQQHDVENSTLLPPQKQRQTSGQFDDAEEEEDYCQDNAEEEHDSVEGHDDDDNDDDALIF